MGVVSRLVLVFVFGSIAEACQICVPLPTATLADWIIDSRAVVFAREDPANPFHFATVETLKGDDELPALELFVDSSTRRLQSRHPDHRAICVWDDQEDTPRWRRVGAIKDTVGEQLVRDIIRLAPAWENSPEDRFNYFSRHLGTSHPVTGPLAYLEVGQASYRQIRTLRGQVDRTRIRAFLADLQMLEWHALYILLLGQSDHPDDQQLIRDSMGQRARTSIDYHTAAWATALIEVDGEAGVSRLLELYLKNPPRKDEAFLPLLTALQVQGDGGRADIKNAIVSAYGEILHHWPSHAPSLADDLTRWQRFDHVDAFTQLLEEQTLERNEIARIRYHLISAKSGGKPPDPN